MALADFAAFVAAVEHPNQTARLTVPPTTAVIGKWFDLWVTALPAVGAAPTTAVVPTNATAGSFGQIDSASGTLGVAGARLTALNPGTYLLIDRLSHQGGLVANITTSQTTNLPTATLTRYTDGVGVMIGLTIYTAIGATGSTVSVTYTDSASASKTTAAIAIGATGVAREAGRILLPSLPANGTVGVKAVQSVIVNTTSTGTAGNFGVTLFKPLAALIVDEQHGVTVCDVVSGRIGGGMPEVVDGACLSLLYFGTTTNMVANGSIMLEEW